MNSIPFADFRHGLSACFLRAGAALGNTLDALLTDPSARSFPELSLSPFFQRRWSSLYQAVQDGQIDRAALQKLFVAHLPEPSPGQRLILGIDASSIYRPLAPTSRDRTAQFVHNLPHVKAPVQPGWSFSTLLVLPETPSSWTYLLDNQRIESSKTAAEVAGSQLRTLLPRLKQRFPRGPRPLLLGDRYYGSAAFLQQIRTLPIDGLFRIQGHRCFYRAAPSRLPAGQNPPGAPRKDGDPFKCKDPSTWGSPDASWEGLDEKGKKIQVLAWNGLHFQECREGTLCVVRVSRPSALDTKRDPRVSWFILVGEPLLLSEVPRTYRLRFSQEHGYRFDKGSLLWAEPHFRTPEQFQRWTDLVAAAHNQLVVARPWAEAIRRPWEGTQRAATPQQVRRAMGRIIGELGPLAPPPQPRGKSPGRPKGALVKRSPRHPVVLKADRNGKKRGSGTTKPHHSAPNEPPLSGNLSSSSLAPPSLLI